MNLDKTKISQQLGITENDYEELIQDALEYMGGAIQELEEALSHQDFGRVSAVAHRINGSSGSLQLASIHETAKAIEQMSLETKDLQSLQERTAHLKEAFNEFRDFMRESA